MFIDYFLRIALIVVLSMTMVNASKADTIPATVTWSMSWANNSCNSEQVSNSGFASCSAVMAAYSANFPTYNCDHTNRADLINLNILVNDGVTCSASRTYQTTRLADGYKWAEVTGNVNATRVLQCPSGYTLNGESCIQDAPVCPADGIPLSAAGYYDLGTSTLVVQPPLSTCHNGCLHHYVGDSVGFRALIGGVYHYYAKGFYESSGGECTSGASVPDSIATAPNESCAPGQNYGTVNGKRVCLNSDGSVSSADSAEALAAAAAAEAARIKAVIERARQVAEAEAAAAGGTAEEIVAAGNGAASAAAGVAAASNSDGSVLGEFCEKTPDSPICIETDLIKDEALEKTIDVAITPVAVSGDGSCPAPSPLEIRGQTYFFEWTTYCNFASGIKPILLAFAWLSAAGIMVGGFRT